MAVAIPFIMLAGAAVSAYGAVSQANAQKQAATFNAALNERNALVATQQSTAEAERIRRSASRVQGSMVAGLGASGLTLEGSALDALGDSAAQAQLDIETVKYRGKLQAMGYHSNAQLDQMQGDVAQEQGYYRAASEVLTGVGRAGATWSAGTRRVGGTNTYAE
jgi:hypothetical protein